MLRIVSLIPSATEIVHALGLTHALVGRSHECDYPPQVQALPVCTEPKFNPDGTSQQIHDRVTDLLQSALSVYRVKTEVLEQLQPTHILTQAQCEVCAVSLADVEQATAKLVSSQPQIISLQPNRLAELWTDLDRVAAALDTSAAQLTASLLQRIEKCTAITRSLSPAERPTIACIEWIEPLMAAGNWIPELVDLAGGKSLFGTIGQHSPWLQWNDLIAANPDVIAVMPCGFDLERTGQEAKTLTQHPGWAELRAVQQDRVYITDGNQYFNRPGPRLVDSLEILAEVLHPGLFHSSYQERGWRSL